MKVRNRTFALEAELLARDWNDDDVCLTHTFSVASVILELGELHLVEFTSALLPRLGNPEVRARARLFAGQESNHRAVHARYNRGLLTAGYRLGPLYRAVDLFIRAFRRLLPDHVMLAFLVSVEFLAALTAERLFTGKLGATVACADSEVARFWRWHLAEEVEHRMVLHETYRSLGGGRVLLVLTTWILATIFYLFINAGMVWLALTRGTPLRRVLGSLFHYNFGRVGTAFWLPLKLLKASCSGFDPARICDGVSIESHL
jgi:predicted metal-dependent hydrolase